MQQAYRQFIQHSLRISLVQLDTCSLILAKQESVAKALLGLLTARICGQKPSKYVNFEKAAFPQTLRVSILHSPPRNHIRTVRAQLAPGEAWKVALQSY